MLTAFSTKRWVLGAALAVIGCGGGDDDPMLVDSGSAVDSGVAVTDGGATTTMSDAGTLGSDSGMVVVGDSGPLAMDDSGADMGDAATSNDGSAGDGSVGDGSADHEGDITMGRLLVADGTAASVRIVDLDEGLALPAFTVGSTARVYANPTGRYAYAVQATSGLVNIFDSGILFVSHEDHYHITESDPSMLVTSFSGNTPIHFVVHGEEGMPNSWYATAFNDGSGMIEVLQERSLSAVEPFMFTANSGAPHHGVALVAHGHVIVSHPTPGGGSLPNGVTVREIATPDTIEQTYDICPGLHGEATNHHGIAFGCSDGVLLLEMHDDHFDAAKLDYPDTVPDDVRVGTIASSHELEHFVGNWDGGLVIIDPENEPHFTPVAIAETVLSFQIDAHGETLVVLTAEGNLHRLDPATGQALGAPLSVIQPFTIQPGHGQVRPAFTLGAERAFVIDPRLTEVLEVHVDDWEIERRIEVGGSPGSIAIFSVSPDFGAAHDHMHD